MILLKIYFFSSVTEFIKYDTPLNNLYNSVLKAIESSFALENYYLVKSIDNDKDKINYYSKILKFLNDLLNVEDDNSKIDVIKKFLNTFYIKINDSYDFSVLFAKLKNKNKIYFRFDEIGNIRSNPEDVKFMDISWREKFIHFKNTHNRFYSLDILRGLLNEINLSSKSRCNSRGKK